MILRMNFGKCLFILFVTIIYFVLLGLAELFSLAEENEAVTLPQFSAMPVLSRLNVAHRGASFLAPENTLMAYRIAISAGADGAECDVYKTADNILVLSHDKSTNRTANGKKHDITKTTFDELRKLDVGIWKGKQFKNEKIPTLDEYLELLKETKCSPVVEIKMNQIEKEVIETIRKQDMISVTIIIAFSEQVVKNVRRLEPNICVAWLYSENLKNKGGAENNADRLAEFLLKKSAELNANILDLNHEILSQKLVTKLKNSGIHVWCWTVNDVERMKILLDWGVESITTDRPELLNELLKKYKPIHTIDID
ncbi:MAG: hypothetical protein LBP59_12020 [Planctomycetaceae bacterium]|jgi:glycerophosphoryl diester phosphodiesterase|nr:hypothetical protein [Planctomycetaceae bacterium]